jgi:Domain of unknown function (DUF5658)
MLQLFAVLWLVGAVDLFLTIWAHRFTPFFEANPLARGFLETGAVGLLVLFKTATTLFGSGLLWATRRHRRAEFALWGVVVVHILLAIRWSNYTDRCLQVPPTSISAIEVAMR